MVNTSGIISPDNQDKDNKVVDGASGLEVQILGW